MVVDDEPDLASVIAQVLAPEFEVVVAPNGLEALERIDRYEPDVIVMDVMMPVLDGFDTTRAIKKNARFANVPIIFLTARSDNDSLREGMLTGGEIYIQKPFEAAELLARIQELITKNKVTPRMKQFSIKMFLPEESVTLTPTSLPGPAAPKPATPASRPTPGELRSLAPFPSPVPAFPPISPPPISTAEQYAHASGEPRLRILSIDDDLDTVNYIRSCLQRDYEVIGLTESEQAPDKIIAYQPDIILLDIHMPKLNGFHLSHLIRLNKGLKGAKVIFVSSRTDREAVEEAFRLGASDFLEKPFTPERLRRKIMDVVRKPDFQKTKKRVTYAEILRREGLA